MENYSDALKFYKKLKIDFPYDSYTYLAEERIYQLQQTDKIKLPEITIKNTEIEEPITKTEPKIKPNISGKNTYLQIGAFNSLSSAAAQKKKITLLGLDCITFNKMKNSKKLFIAAVGPLANDNSMKKAKNILDKNSISYFKITH